MWNGRDAVRMTEMDLKRSNMIDEKTKPFNKILSLDFFGKLDELPPLYQYLKLEN